MTANVRVREVALSMSVTDGEALLAPAVLERIAAAVAARLNLARESEASRTRDTHIGGDCGCGGSGEHP
jgi:hypothetical protein